MSINIPPPVITAYEVFEVKPTLDQQTRRVKLQGEAPRHVNTEDIKAQVYQPGLFILRWQEIHYEVGYNANGAPQLVEKFHTFHHYENQRRVEKLRDQWEQPQQGGQSPNVISLEQELIDLGWQFQYHADVGPLIPDQLVYRVNWLLPGTQTAGTEPAGNPKPIEQSAPTPEPTGYWHPVSNQPPEPVTPVQTGGQKSDRLETLLLKLERLIGVAEQLVATETTGHQDFGTGYGTTASQLGTAVPTAFHQIDHRFDRP